MVEIPSTSISAKGFELQYSRLIYYASLHYLQQRTRGIPRVSKLKNYGRGVTLEFEGSLIAFNNSVTRLGRLLPTTRIQFQFVKISPTCRRRQRMVLAYSRLSYPNSVQNTASFPSIGYRWPQFCLNLGTPPSLGAYRIDRPSLLPSISQLNCLTPWSLQSLGTLHCF